MAVADVSAGNQNTVGPFQESLEQKAVIDPAGTHESDQTNIGRILNAGYPRQVGSGISAPVANKGQYFGFFGFHIELNIQLSYRLKIEDLMIEFLKSSIFNFKF
jgi:hypothetical protein